MTKELFSPYSIALTFALALVGPALAQSSPADIAVAKRVNATLDAAKSLQKSDPEEAAFKVALARQIAAELPGTSAPLTSRIQAIARRVDTQDAARQKAITKAARLLIKAGLRYLEAGWKRSAEPMLREAARLDPAAARKAIAKLDGAARQGASASGGGLLAELLEQGDSIWGEDEWAFEGDGLQSPSYDKSKVLRIGAQRYDFTKRGWRASMQFDRETDREVGLVFAYRHIEQYGLLRVRPAVRNVKIEVVTVHDAKENIISTQTIDLGETPPDQLQVTLSAKSGEWSVRLEGYPSFATERPDTDICSRGFVGLYLKGTRSANEPLRFQSLTMEAGR